MMMKITTPTPCRLFKLKMRCKGRIVYGHTPMRAMQVWEAVSPRLEGRPEVLDWLRKATRPLKQQQQQATAA